jgi:lactate dehydrogenase-like 2-hydroxyacid dehydrogenase
MKIAVITPVKHLDGISELLSTKGEIFYLEEGTKFEVRTFLLEHSIDTILCNPNQQTYKIDEDLLKDTNVSLINTCSTGMNHIDIQYCINHDIKIYSLTNDYELINELPSTAELAFGLMLAMLRKIPTANKHVSNYNWDYTKFIGRQIKDLNVGIIGFGRLGKLMFKYCDAFGANVKIYDPYATSDLDDRFRLNYTCSSLRKLIEHSDVISIHVHVSDETKYMINKQLLGYSIKKPYIINTSRGEIVNEDDIVTALDENLISGYATDVIENEFDNIANSPIIRAMNNGKNILITPHVGGMTWEGQKKAYEWAINKF